MTMKKTIVLSGLVAVLAAPLAAPAQGMASYEPQQRLRTSLETCRKTEFESGAYCVMKCAPDFRLDASAKKPTCVATRAGAIYEPPKPAYTPPPAQPGAAKVPGA
jgi:hypothetical protein